MTTLPPSLKVKNSEPRTGRGSGPSRHINRGHSSLRDGLFLFRSFLLCFRGVSRLFLGCCLLRRFLFGLFGGSLFRSRLLILGLLRCFRLRRRLLFRGLLSRCRLSRLLFLLSGRLALFRRSRRRSRGAHRVTPHCVIL